MLGLRDGAGSHMLRISEELDPADPKKFTREGKSCRKKRVGFFRS